MLIFFYAKYLSIVFLLTSFIDCRGSLGFGEEALQSLPGNVGSQVPVLSFII